MTPQDFCYWLQGLLEVGKPQSLDATQIAQIQDHLNLVFEKRAPIPVTLVEEARRILEQREIPDKPRSDPWRPPRKLCAHDTNPLSSTMYC